MQDSYWMAATMCGQSVILEVSVAGTQHLFSDTTALDYKNHVKVLQIKRGVVVGQIMQNNGQVGRVFQDVRTMVGLPAQLQTMKVIEPLFVLSDALLSGPYKVLEDDHPEVLRVIALYSSILKPTPQQVAALGGVSPIQLPPGS